MDTHLLRPFSFQGVFRVFRIPRPEGLGYCLLPLRGS
jgi:hypothetical protein